MPTRGQGGIPHLPAHEPTAPGQIRLLAQDEIAGIEAASVGESLASDGAAGRFAGQAGLRLFELAGIRLRLRPSPQEAGRRQPAATIVQLLPTLHIPQFPKGHATARVLSEEQPELVEAVGADLDIVIEEDQRLGLGV